MRDRADPATLVGSPAGATGGTEAPAPAGSGFAAALAEAGASETGEAGLTGTGAATGLLSPVSSYASTPGLSGLAAGGGGGERMLAAAESQIGQSEQPPGSNESPAIAEYRSATAGATRRWRKS